MKTPYDPRHLARRFALQIIFAWEDYFRLNKNQDLTDSDLSYSVAKQIYLNWKKENNEKTKKRKINYKLAQSIIKKAIRNKEKIDQLIKKSAPEWPLDQIATVDLGIMRLAIAELMMGKSAPYKVIIDEAVELSKEFGGENSSKFVNGVLGTVVNELEIKEDGEEDDEEKEDEGNFATEEFLPTL